MKFCILILLFTLILLESKGSQYTGFELPYLRPYLPQERRHENYKTEGSRSRGEESYRYRQELLEGPELNKEALRDKYELFYGPNFRDFEGRRFDGYGPKDYEEDGYERGNEYKERPLILGRFGLGFDRRTASSNGLQQPLTLHQLQTIGQGYSGRLNRIGGPIPIEYYDSSHNN